MSSTTQEIEQTQTESSISNLLVLKPLRDPCKPTTENSRLLVWNLGTFQPFAPRFSAVTARVANPWPAQCQTNLGRSDSAKQQDPSFFIERECNEIMIYKYINIAKGTTDPGVDCFDQ